MHHISLKAAVPSVPRYITASFWQQQLTRALRMSAKHQDFYRWDVDIVVDEGDPAWGNSSCNALIEVVQVLEVLCG